MENYNDMVEFKLAPFEETKKENTDFKLVDPTDSEFKLVPLKEAYLLLRHKLLVKNKEVL